MTRTLEGTLGTLSRQQVDALQRLADEAHYAPLTELMNEVIGHVAEARQARKDDPLVNVPLAEALSDVIRRLIDAWDTGHFRPEVGLQYDAGYWLRGAIRYFCREDDEEPDFSSPLGFEDDAEVLNACLRLAGLDDWCIHPQDYDDA